MPNWIATLQQWSQHLKATSDSYCNADKLETLVATYGAAVTGIHASDHSFNQYSNGVYNKCTKTSTNHAILIVGHGTDEL